MVSTTADVSACSAAQATASSEPRSWGELLNSYRDSHGSRSYSTTDTPVRHYTRSVPGLCPLAETHHPLFSVGATGHHTINDADGSAYRSQRHGWGNTSLLKEGFAGEPHPRGMQQHAAGKRTGVAPCEGGRNGLWGLLQGSEAGGADSWIGNASIDPTKGKRSVAAPSDAKRVDMGRLLAQTAPGESFGADAWIGNIGINPAKGKGHAADAAALRGRADLFAILQQRLLQEAGGGSSSGRPAVDEDAFIGNRLIVPGKGKKSVDSPAAADTLHGALFKGPAPADACWSDMPRIGKRPLVPPSNARCFVTAAQAMAVEVPLPASAVMGPARAQGKAMLHTCALGGTGSSSQASDIWALMSFKPLTGAETQRWQQAWTDARAQTRRKALPDATAAGGAGLQQLVAAQPGQVTVRRVPHAGGIAQEVGCSLDTIIANRAAVSGKGSAGASAGGRARGGRSSTGARGGGTGGRSSTNKAAGRSGGGST